MSTLRADGAFSWTGLSTGIERGIRFDLVVKGVDVDQTSGVQTLASPLTVGPKQCFLAFLISVTDNTSLMSCFGV